MTLIRTALALAAATALSAATLPAQAQTDTMTGTMTGTTTMESTGALGEVSRVFMTAGDIDDIEVVGINGEDIGEVENVIVGADGTHYVVVDVGGFLDIGDEPVAIPMARLAAGAEEEELILPNMTADTLEELVELTEEMDRAGMRVLGPDDEIQIRMMQ
ncbi:MAG: PRC-barrel domain-containing protein [Salinarimonas sp.]